jgi:hypothetical protein
MLDLAARELPAGAFPGSEVREYFVDSETAMSTTLKARLSRADGATSERRRALLELWGPRPYGLRNLDPTLHRAFDLPQLADELLTEAGDTDEEVSVELTRTSQETGVHRLFEELEKWGRNETTLGDKFAQTLRDWVFEAVLAQVDWEALSEGRSDDLLNEIGVPDASRCVSIEGSRGDTRSGLAGAAVFTVERSERSVRLLRGLVELNRHKSWAFTDGEDGMLVVGNVTAPWVAEIESRLRARGRGAGAIDSGFVAGMLAMTGLILGLGDSVDPPESVSGALSLALTPFDPSSETGTTDRSDEWKRLRQAAAAAPRGRETREVARRALLRRLGRTQGRGESIVAIDIADAVNELGRVCAEWKPSEVAPDAAPEDKRWADGVANTLEAAVRAETKRLSEWSKRVMANIDVGSKTALDEVVVEVEAVLGEIARLGKGASSDAFVRRALQGAQRVDEHDFRELVGFYQQDTAVVAWPQLLARAAKDWSAVTGPIDDLIRQAASYLDVIERSLDRETTGGDGTGPLAMAGESITAALEELSRSLKAGRTEVHV